MSFNKTLNHIQAVLDPHSDLNRGIPVTKTVKVDRNHLRDLHDDWQRLDREIRKAHAENQQLREQVNDMKTAAENRDPDIVGIA